MPASPNSMCWWRGKLASAGDSLHSMYKCDFGGFAACGMYWTALAPTKTHSTLVGNIWPSLHASAKIWHWRRRVHLKGGTSRIHVEKRGRWLCKKLEEHVKARVTGTCGRARGKPCVSKPLPKYQNILNIKNITRTKISKDCQSCVYLRFAVHEVRHEAFPKIFLPEQTLTLERSKGQYVLFLIYSDWMRNNKVNGGTSICNV